MKSIFWNVKFFNPVDGTSILREETHSHIQSLADKYPHIPLPTWRNMGMGRSKVYEPFITLEKQKKEIPDMDSE